jgi:predicted DNA binding protein
MKLKHLIELKSALNSVDDLKCTFKFSYAIAKNKRKIKDIIEEYEAALTPSEKYSEYEEKRVALARKLAKKDEDGQPIIKNSAFLIEPNEQVKFEKELAVIKSEYTEEVEKYELKQKGYIKALNEEVEIEFHMINEDDLPELTPKQMDAIIEFIKI